MTFLLRAFPILFAVALLSGCQMFEASEDPTRFFVLQNSNKNNTAAPKSSLDRKIVLYPVRIPKYLDRPHIVSRKGDNSISQPDFARWGEPLDDGIARILISELDNSLGSGTAYHFPYTQGSDEKTPYELHIELNAFEVVNSDEVVLKARWRAVIEGESKPLASGREIIKTSVKGRSQDDAVRAMSTALHDFANTLASAFNN